MLNFLISSYIFFKMLNYNYLLYPQVCGFFFFFMVNGFLKLKFGIEPLKLFLNDFSLGR